MTLFSREKYTLVNVKKKSLPALWTKCPECSATIYNKELESNLNVCVKCGWHFTINVHQRIALLFDEGTFQEKDPDFISADPLDFKGPKTYKEKIAEDQEKTNLKDAAITGEGKIYGERVAFAATDSRFIMGSMGSVVGEKVSRIIEFATKNKLAIVIVSGSGGGARMYEGAISLMQMAKTCACLGRHHDAGLLHISVLTNPTMGGIMASFAGVGDIIMAEPKALVGFAGPRVIEQTIRQKLPKGFQTSEFMLAHGLIDQVVDRREMKKNIYQIIQFTKNSKPK
ncbi:MAG TPA: acetyl-CoA carboxylase, carboxyltransferase subunit beta [Candidatus Omnitrophota bacterium]|nr:acetyl-CoA carboxylase, carboxyltransferase subunit beta [Candidatus Omnitrophota bacterium]HPN88262.1 acetyl-CoA carboxylase, carboxyltransferase subunit beta [Candidatus Omnitrophota bacterium]